MTNEVCTDEEVKALHSIKKRVINPGARFVTKPGRRQRNFKLGGVEYDSARFEVCQRQNESDKDDFSCEIAYIPPDGRQLTLGRYNGPSHIHGSICYRPHVQRAMASAIAAGKNPMSEANETDRITSLDGAFRCLIEDFRFRVITTPHPDQPRIDL